MINFSILNRWTGSVQFTAQIDCAEDAPRPVKMRLSVKWAIETRANLTRANLTRANLTRANLTDANLTDADLTDADLTDADLTAIRNDFWDVLLRAQEEIPALLNALRAGNISGSTYTGKCCCLVGTIAKARNVYYANLSNGLLPNANRPIERFFMGIQPGNTPDNSIVSKVVENWILEFQSLIGAVTAEAAPAHPDNPSAPAA